MRTFYIMITWRRLLFKKLIISVKFTVTLWYKLLIIRHKFLFKSGSYNNQNRNLLVYIMLTFVFLQHYHVTKIILSTLVCLLFWEQHPTDEDVLWAEQYIHFFFAQLSTKFINLNHTYISWAIKQAFLCSAQRYTRKKVLFFLIIMVVECRLNLLSCEYFTR